MVQVRERYTSIEATAPEQAAVAGLMASTETPFGRPSLDIHMATLGHGALLLSPSEPVDEPGDE
ncbi:MAG TPA: hypothetical protein VGM60_18470 [Pseudonocardia sp.]|jgi:hypothetical protein|uniref:hypothetical protein n=1 Tax=Pseudonocardia sp. TaxID=60912 RepID=UPI002F41D7D7